MHKHTLIFQLNTHIVRGIYITFPSPLKSNEKLMHGEKGVKCFGYLRFGNMRFINKITLRGL